jgi:hypothetical protein
LSVLEFHRHGICGGMYPGAVKLHHSEVKYSPVRIESVFLRLVAIPDAPLRGKYVSRGQRRFGVAANIPVLSPSVCRHFLLCFDLFHRVEESRSIAACSKAHSWRAPSAGRSSAKSRGPAFEDSGRRARLRRTLRPSSPPRKAGPGSGYVVLQQG